MIVLHEHANAMENWTSGVHQNYPSSELKGRRTF